MLLNNSNTQNTVLDTGVITDFVLLVGRTNNDDIDDVLMSISSYLCQLENTNAIGKFSKDYRYEVFTSSPTSTILDWNLASALSMQV